MVIRSLTSIAVRWRRGEDGQAIVEFALIAPIFLLLVFGLVEFGKAWMTLQTMTDAAREGLRTAVVANPTVTLDTVVARVNTNLAGSGMDTAAVTKTITGFRAGTGSEATITLTYPYHLQWLQPFMGWTNAQASFTMNTSMAMRNE